MREVPLENQVYAYWWACRDLRLARECQLNDEDAFADLADLATFTDHAGLRRVCLSWLKCAVTDSAEAAS